MDSLRSCSWSEKNLGMGVTEEGATADHGEAQKKGEGRESPQKFNVHSDMRGK